MLDFSRFEYLSFDCYGTLIDWESGILGYLRPLLQSKGCRFPMRRFSTSTARLSHASSRSLIAAIARFWPRWCGISAANFAFQFTEEEADGLADSIGEWQPFPDTVRALKRLKSRYKLAVLSNIDDDLFAFTAPKLGVQFDCVVTAQQVQSYKPSLAQLRNASGASAHRKGRLLHVAESLYHDVVPAHELGIATVWVNRRQGKAAAATRLVAAQPDLEVPTVAALADLAVS